MAINQVKAKEMGP